MRFITSHAHPTTHLGRVSVPVLLGFALAAGACASDGTPSSVTAPDTNVATSEEPAATTTPTTTTPMTTAPATTGPPSTSPSTSPSTGSTGTESNGDGVDAFLDQLETTGFDGVVALRDGNDVTTRAFGVADRENEVRIDDETVFDIGSLTKQFTAAAIVRLEVDGRLSVDDALGDHVPGLPDDTASITLHQLLTHTAGVPHSLGPDDEPIGRTDFLALVGQTPLISEPGERFEYSNVGYALLAAVIEFETGVSYETYLRTALFEPAGMLDTGYVLPDWDGHTIAVGYDAATDDRFGRPDEQPWDIDGPYWHLLGNGGLMSTAADMLRWDEVLGNDDVLDEAARAKLFTPHAPVSPGDDIAYAYGWQIIPTPMGTTLVTHDGGNGVFYADFLRFVDEGVTVLVMTNSDRDEDGDLALRLANQALDGDLASVLDSDSEVAGDDAADVEAAHCAFGALSADSPPDYLELDALPDSPAGRTVSEFLDLLVDGDAAARLDFAADHVADRSIGEDPAEIAIGFEDLQSFFADHDVVRVLQQDDLQLHLVMQGPDADVLLSMGFDETVPDRIVCLAVSP